MRTSSIKSTVSTLLLTVIITVAVPAADARPMRETFDRPGNFITRTFLNLVRRFGNIVSYARPSVPIGTPEEGSGDTTTSTTPTTTTEIPSVNGQ